MPRIRPTDRDRTDADTAKLLDGVERKLGKLPNLISTMARSRVVAESYLAFAGHLGNGVLPARLREQIALVVGETNQCEYCVAAHTALGRGAGLATEETLAARRGESGDARERAALAFARTIVEDRGRVGDDDLERVREAGFTDAEITEIVANVALNLFTNYFNHVAGTEVDFPAVDELAA